MVINRTNMTGFVARILNHNCILANNTIINTAYVAFTYTSNVKDDFDEDFRTRLDNAVNELFDSEYFSNAYKTLTNDGHCFEVLLTYNKNIQIDESK